MDKRQMLGAISLSVAVFALWMIGVNWYQKHNPQPVAPLDVPSATTGPSAAPSTVSATSPTTHAVMTAATGLRAVESVDQSAPNVVLGSNAKNDPNYALQLVLSPLGGGIDDVTLNQFPSPASAHVAKDKKAVYQFESPLADPATSRVLATRQLVINGVEIDLSNKRWTSGPSDPESAQFYIYIDDASGHVAKVTKTYRIEKRNATSGSLGYEVAVTQEVADARPDADKAKPFTVHSIINGPTPPPAEVEQGTDRAVVAGYAESKSNIKAEPKLLSEFKHEDVPQKLDYVDGKPASAPAQDPARTLYTNPFEWVGQSSSYFAAIVLPAKSGAHDFYARALSIEGAKPEDLSVSLSFETIDQPVSSAASATTAMTVFFGPKWRQVLNTEHYSASPRMYSKLLEFKSMCSFIVSDKLIAGLVWILRAFHVVFKDWGLAIICLVLLVRAALHPLTKKSQVQMMKMGKMSPEVEKLKKKYADQPDVLNKEMMKLYKEQSGAILGCLPMFLQTPIWIALWSALQGTFELRQEPFLYGWTWIKDLSRPDGLFHFGGPIKVLFFTLYGINLLPLLMAVVTYVNQKYFMPMPIAATPEQEQQQKMQRGMSLIFPLMFYALPSGLNLYYLTSMSLGIVESKIIRDHIKQQEEAEKAGRVFVSTKPTRGSRRRDDRDEDDDKKKPKTGLSGRLLGMMEKMQERAEEIRKESQKRDAKDKRDR